MKTSRIGIGVALAALLAAGCGPACLKALNWENHVTVRTCVEHPGTQTVADICDGYQLPNQVDNPITDLDYAVIQIEHIYFRDLPEWTRDSEVSIDVTVRGLLPGGKDYRQVLDIVHVKKEANLQLQNVNIFFPVRYENRIISLQFSLRELDKQEGEKAKAFFKKGKGILSKIGSNPLAGTFLGTLLASEVVAEVADLVIDQLTSDDHIFSLKQVDFLPAMDSGATEPQLLFTQGRYVVVGIPPVDAYDYLEPQFKDTPVDFPERLNRAWLINNTAYKGGLLVFKGSEQDYTFTPYISFNFTILPRYAERSTVVESIKQAFRCLAIEPPDLQCATTKTATALAEFKTDAQFSFRSALIEEKVIPEKPGALLDMDPAKLLGQAEKLVKKQQKKKIDKFIKQFFGVQLQVPGLTGTTKNEEMKTAATDETAAAAPAATRIPDAAELLEGAGTGIYTEREYAYFIAVLNALSRIIALKSTDAPDLKQRVETLDVLLGVKLRNRDVTLFQSECTVMKKSVESQLLDLKRAAGIPAFMKMDWSDPEMAKTCTKLFSKTEEAQWCFDNLPRLQQEADWFLENCTRVIR